ncbi:MAG: hypothetical protein WBS24_13760 [Terriglobales bacterium]
MKRLTGYLLMSTLVLGGLGTLSAQEAATQSPPKVLSIIREYLKPGKSGETHEKSESAFVQALRGAKWPTHYLAVDSLSGRPRSLFLTGFGSFEEMEKDMRNVEKNPGLMSALDRAGVVDGELLSDTDSAQMAFREDMSLRAGVDIPHMRYLEISLIHVRPGHEKDWEALVKMYMTAFEKINDVHWATYQVVYGAADGSYIIFNPMKSASEVDHSFAVGKQFESDMGEEGMKKLNELAAAAIESSQTNMFVFNPRMSYVSDEWIKADPDFWNPKAAHAAATKKKEEPNSKK